MVTAKVKDLSAQVMNFAQGASAKVQTGNGADSFQNVLNKQADSSGRPAVKDREPVAKAQKPEGQEPAQKMSGTEPQEKKLRETGADVQDVQLGGDVQQTDEAVITEDAAAQEPQTVPEDATPPEEMSKTPAPDVQPAKEPEDVPKESADADAVKNVPAKRPEKEVLPEDGVNAAMEAVMQLICQVADAFDMTSGQVEELMQDMGIEKTDLLSADQLGNLVLEASGAEGSFELVTDGELYQKFRQIMESRTELAETAAREMEVTPEELPERLAETMQAVETQEQELPVKSTAADERWTAERPQTDEIRTADEAESQKAERQETQGTTVPVMQPAGEKGSDESAADQKEAEPQIPGRQTQRTERREASHEHAGGNLVLQQMRETDALQEVQGQDVPEARGTDTQNIMRQIMDYMKVQIRSEVSSLEMQLHPASLGTVQVQLASRAGAVTAQFIAQNETVKAALETQMIQLRESFEEQGIRVDAIEVSVQTRGFERNLDEQGRDRGGQQQPGGRGRRRIRLDADLLGPEQLSELEPDERLAADMMKANGGTVDYTA